MNKNQEGICLKKIITLIIVSIITVVFLLGFINRNPKNNSESKAELVYSVSEISQNLKSVGDISKRQQDIICATSIGLIEIDSNGEIVPDLAESIEVKDEGIEYDFKIRDDLYWSDGVKIKAADMVTFFREFLT